MTTISKTTRLLLVTCSLFCCVFSWSMDTDSDGVLDSTDNCTSIRNGLAESVPDQINTNAGSAPGQDEIGNACDPDFNNDCLVNFLDLQILVATWTSFSAPGTILMIDTNISGPVGVPDNVINFLDFFRFKEFFFSSPGPTWNGECS